MNVEEVRWVSELATQIEQRDPVLRELKDKNASSDRVCEPRNNRRRNVVGTTV